jgi:hypothetical protein
LDDCGFRIKQAAHFSKDFIPITIILFFFMTMMMMMVMMIMRRRRIQTEHSIRNILQVTGHS